MYLPIAGWGSSLPDARGRDLPDVAVGSNGDVYVLYRQPSFVAVSNANGELQRVVGDGTLNRPHGVAVGGDRIYVVDESDHCICVFDMDGSLVSRIGSGPSDPSFPPLGLHVDRIVAPLPPFTRPTRLACAPWGDLFVSDGYGNCRIHRFSSEGILIGSWGEPGTEPGQFRVPHAVAVDRRDRVLVCDRENDRIQVFDIDGRLTEVWPDLQRPQAVLDGGEGRYYVAEGIRPREPDADGGSGPDPSGIAVLDESGRLVARTRTHPDDGSLLFLGAHSIARDEQGSVYVTECAASILRTFPDLGTADRPAFYKLRPAGGPGDQESSVEN